MISDSTFLFRGDNINNNNHPLRIHDDPLSGHTASNCEGEHGQQQCGQEHQERLYILTQSLRVWARTLGTSVYSDSVTQNVGKNTGNVCKIWYSHSECGHWTVTSKTSTYSNMVTQTVGNDIRNIYIVSHNVAGTPGTSTYSDIVTQNVGKNSRKI